MTSLRLRTAVAGFTLIELMIVVAIIGILAAIAIPQYGDYITRSRWQDNYQLAGSIKQAIAECAQANGQTGSLSQPCDRTGSSGDTDPTLGLIGAGFLPSNFTASGKFLASLTYGTGVGAVPGVIRFTGTAAASNCNVRLTPQLLPTGIQWQFSNEATPACRRGQTGVGS